MDRRVWQATVHGVTKSQTWLSTHTPRWLILVDVWQKRTQYYKTIILKKKKRKGQGHVLFFSCAFPPFCYWNWQKSHQFLRTTYTLAPFRPTGVTKLTFPKKKTGVAAVTKTPWRSRAQLGERCSSVVFRPPPQSSLKKRDNPKSFYRTNDTPEMSHGSPWDLGEWDLGKFTSLLWVSTLPFIQCFPHSAVGKESACNARDPGSILGSGRSPGEGIGYPL